MDNLLKYQWHHLPTQEVTQILNSNLEAGLTLDEVAKRSRDYGPNQLTAQAGKSSWLRFIEQFNQPLVYILLLAGVVTALLQEWVDSGVIFGVVLINAIIGFVQESKAESEIAALAAVVTTEATVIRNEEKLRIPSSELVPGDLVLLTSGDKVPADLRLIEVRDLQVDESALTGESVPVSKEETEQLDPETPLAERTNIAYAGSLVTFGQADGIVVAIAGATETGRISQLIEQTTSLTTPLTRKIQKLSRTLLYVILALAALTFVVGLAQGDPWVYIFQAAVALAVGAIPEGLPAVVTITLAIGVSRMARRHAIIRHLAAVETLGSTTIICSDKTGTLTENEMTVQDIYAGGQHYTVTGVGYLADGEILLDQQPVNLAHVTTLQECLRAGLLCNDSHFQKEDGQWEVIGDPTEGALIAVARKAGLTQQVLEKEMPRLDTIPFESQFQYMATLHEDSLDKTFGEASVEPLIYLKGSTEAILKRCAQMLDAQGHLAPMDIKQVEREANAMANRGLRVLAFAKKPMTVGQEELDHPDVQEDLILLGLQGMIDPPRPEAIAAIEACKLAGIQVKMITGDHALTAAAIAHMMGLQSEKAQVFTGQELARMNHQQLANAVEDSMVFARVAPEQKLHLVKALQSKGEIVAMTGDGVNDAPALKQADIGTAMGMDGTEVAKEAADMILTDDNFASIEAAVEEGRTVYQNLRRTIAFLLPISGGESMTIFIAVLLNTDLPILPVQILWLNMVSAIALTVPLAFEPKSSRVMQQPPRNPNEPLLSGTLIRRVLAISAFNWVVTFGVFEWILLTTDNLDLARTMAVNTLVASEIFYLLSISRFVPSIFTRMRGKTVEVGYAPAIGVACMVTLQVLFSQWSIMNQLFHTAPLSLVQGLTCIGIGLPVILIAILLKRVESRS